MGSRTVCVSVCVYEYASECIHVCVHVYAGVFVCRLCVHVWCVHVSRRLSVCIHVCVHVCVGVSVCCLCAHVCILCVRIVGVYV